MEDDCHDHEYDGNKTNGDAGDDGDKAARYDYNDDSAFVGYIHTYLRRR